MQIRSLKIGTRGSALALAQAHEVRNALLRAHKLPQEAIEIVPISTRGDRILNQSLNALGGKGLFTQEIEAALLEKRIDMAVHSAKDMPAVLPKGLYLSAYLRREDPRDVFIGRSCENLADMPPNAVIGTSSIRRGAFLRRLRPDLKIMLLRGNVQTRLKKLAAGAADGTFLAYAGLKRLGLAHKATEILSAEQFIPAPAQGVIAVESRIGDKTANSLLAKINHAETAVTTACERSFMAQLDGSCRTPLGAYAQLCGRKLHLRGAVLTPDGTIFHEIITAAETEDCAAGSAALKAARAFGKKAAVMLKKQAGDQFFSGWEI